VPETVDVQGDTHSGARESPVGVGEPAPDFTLSRVEREGTVSLADYRARSGLLLIVNRGLWCSFCRRYLVQLGGTRERLRPLGVETLAIVASDLARGRLYVKHRPLPVPLAADPDRVTHRAYGVPMPPLTPEIERALEGMRAEPVLVDQTAVSPSDLGDLTAALRAARTPAAAPGAPGAGAARVPLWDFILLQRQLYPYELTEPEQQEWSASRTLGTGQFLIDRDGVVRWAKIRSTTQPPAGLGNFASEAELLAAARALPG
jgi:peroxiredoxin